MKSLEFPKFNCQQKSGRIGELYFEHFVTKELGFVYRAVHNESDFGIDGYVDIVTEGNVTGRSIAVQVKCGDSYLSRKSEGGIKYLGDNKHLNYFLNLNLPVIIIIFDSSCTIGYWGRFLFGSHDSSKNGWWMEIPKGNILDSSVKDKWIDIAGKALDYTKDINASWKANELLDCSRHLEMVIDKDVIEQKDLSGVINIINRLSRKKDSLIKSKNTLKITICGYDDDPRALFEVPEFRSWCLASLELGIPWLYFIFDAEDRLNLELLLYSCCDILVNDHDDISKRVKFVDTSEVSDWMKINIINLRVFVEENNIPKNVGDELCERFLSASFMR